MKQRLLIGLLAGTVLLGSSVQAQESAQALPHLTGADLLVDLQQYVGKQVVLTGLVKFADNNGALLQAGAVVFKISPQDIDRETFRYFLKTCHDGATLWDEQAHKRQGLECRMPLVVTPTGKFRGGNWPELVGVKICRLGC